MAEDLEKQEPEKQKKKEKKAGGNGLPLPMLIGIGVGGVVLVLVTVIFGYFIATKLFPSQQQVVVTNGQVQSEHKAESEEKADVHESLYMETGRITTNPKDAPTTFVVLNLSLEFVPKDKDDEKTKEVLGKEGVNMAHPTIQKMLARVKSTINNQIASTPMAELQSKRPELEKIYIELLKPTFKEFGFKLMNVGLLEFIIQE
jgi:flagellar basal body-associated protein FliL